MSFAGERMPPSPMPHQFLVCLFEFIFRLLMPVQPHACNGVPISSASINATASRGDISRRSQRTIINTNPTSGRPPFRLAALARARDH